ncbi:hypothetical protein CSB07_00340 [Candidatus Gracilibacteria bacterium]|nr:MAG: hypothetical protein CSB07_00340 [Candidatus Gracilibacteria bacterium]PIE85129.1 MAG: hypothetical protein CSA08_03730 [Candidatus Gracilibacteria bacterium]
MTHIKNKKAFTFVELIVASVILIILSAIGFYSYTGLLSDSRDSERKSDLASLKTAFKTYQKTRGFYPKPGNSFNIVSNSLKIAEQGKLNKGVILSTIDEIPYDPYTKTPYSYSTTAPRRQEFQISMSMENADTPIALLAGDYKTVRKNIIPTIMLAYSGSLGENVEVNNGVGDGGINRTLFIFDKGKHNLPYELVSPYLPYSDGSSFLDIINDPSIEFWQNSDYRSCEEIKKAGKNTGNGIYQLLDNTGALYDAPCTF